MARTKKSCWEWISSKIDKKEKQLKNPANIYLTFFVFEDGKVSYNLGTTRANKDYKIGFTSKEIHDCEDIAAKNGLDFDVWYDPKDNPIEAITFIKRV